MRDDANPEIRKGTVVPRGLINQEIKFWKSQGEQDELSSLSRHPHST